jgi:alkanesulfonate monooxygenase SsuD/methylene tetrahydromethanopterin reductase-like flavin-dependent oxidoreductase (luciferase family)
MRLALHLPGFGAGREGGPGVVGFDAYVRLARAAERGLFDFLPAGDRRPSSRRSRCVRW